MSVLYIFLDEGGNFDFSLSGSKYFSLTSVSMMRPFSLHTSLDTYKYDLLEFETAPRIEMEFFHCAEDNSHVRSRVFDLLADYLPDNSVDAVLVEKQKTGPALQMPEKFYPRMLGYLLRFVLDRADDEVSEVIIITDVIPVAKKRRAIEKSLKTVLADMLPGNVPYQIMHHASRAHYGLQVADYLNWAIFRKWERGDDISYRQIEALVRSEFDIFRRGWRLYY